MWILYDTLARIVFNLYAVQLSLTIKGGNAVGLLMLPNKDKDTIIYHLPFEIVLDI